MLFAIVQVADKFDGALLGEALKEAPHMEVRHVAVQLLVRVGDLIADETLKFIAVNVVLDLVIHQLFSG